MASRKREPKTPWLPFAIAGAMTVALLSAVTVSGQAATPERPHAPAHNATDLQGPAATTGWG